MAPIAGGTGRQLRGEHQYQQAAHRDEQRRKPNADAHPSIGLRRRGGVIPRTSVARRKRRLLQLRDCARVVLIEGQWIHVCHSTRQNPCGQLKSPAGQAEAPAAPLIGAPRRGNRIRALDLHGDSFHRSFDPSDLRIGVCSALFFCQPRRKILTLPDIAYNTPGRSYVLTRDPLSWASETTHAGFLPSGIPWQA